MIYENGRVYEGNLSSNIKVNGNAILDMDMDFKNLLIVVHTKDNISMENLKELASINGLMVNSMMANGSME